MSILSQNTVKSLSLGMGECQILQGEKIGILDYTSVLQGGTTML